MPTSRAWLLRAWNQKSCSSRRCSASTASELRPGRALVARPGRGEGGPMEELRRNLAAASRMLVDAGILGYSGHLSTRVGDGGRLLIQPVDDVRAELRPDRLLIVTLEGDVADGDGRPPSELAIRSIPSAPVLAFPVDSGDLGGP